MQSKSKLIKTVAVVLAVSLGCGGYITAQALGRRAKAASPDKSAAADAAQGISSAVQTASDGSGKEETVYVFTDAAGTVRQVIVSDWLKNGAGETLLPDYTELTDLQNVKGDGSYTNGAWEADGNDVYYRGSTEKQPPVTMAVSYQLDGTPISAEELAGKSGHVVIRYDYTNCESRSVTVGGKQETLCVPFAAITVAILDGGTFRNIAVRNGRLVNDGERTLAAGVTFPGMQQALDLDRADYEVPDYIEISADTDCFALGNTFTIVTNKVFSELDTDDIKTADDLKKSMGDLTDAMNKLIDGADDLYDALGTLYSKSGDVESALKKLRSGTSQVRDGAGEVKDGAKKLQGYTGDLKNGLLTLSGKNAVLTGGVKRVFLQLLDSANSQLAASGLAIPPLTIENYSTTLKAAASSLDADAVRQMAYAQIQKQQVEPAVRANEDAIRAGVSQKIQQGILESILAASTETQGMTAERYQQAVEAGEIPNDVQEAIAQSLSEAMNTEAVQASIDEATEAQIQTLIAEKMESSAVQQGIQNEVDKAAAGAGALDTLRTQLDSYNEFYTGLLAYTAGVADAASGASQLSAGTADLYTGAAALSSGAAELSSGAAELYDKFGDFRDGITEIRDGSGELRDGILALNEEGISKLTDAVGDDMEGFLDRLKALQDLSRDYRAFAGIADGETGNVKFIYKTDEIKTA